MIAGAALSASPELQVAQALQAWRAAGRHAVLATVLRTWGSSPRPVGSWMALRDDGCIEGSVSGGCIEDDLLRRCLEDSGGWAGRPPERVRYGMDAEEAHRFGLPCGGTLELLLEYDPDPHALHRLAQWLQERRVVWRHVRCADGMVTLSTDGQSAADAAPALVDRGDAVAQRLGPSCRMLLIGAGALARSLAAMALPCGFAVTVCDPREEHRKGWHLPGVELVTAMPDDAVLAMGMDARTCAIALTHDPKLDDLALLEALQSDAFYVGAIGSAATTAARRQRLQEHFGIGDAALARLRGPIGLAIGSRTPPEIAVSVLAEVLAARNGAALPAAARMSEAARTGGPAVGNGACGWAPRGSAAA
ncbi:XdhC family protein [Paracidovorax konjaci]|uniref:Xanthine dehydrogenase accessory factor n=1 Tax=Paracidovorax konjaci TaxID=32040 RepID=A0A1I1SCY4_9BURK|nr:XdhC family protein [Paracidovorax konjaci]SFD44384.1 xanthine dehydrogenase accessory factor [Paracidovorax konjaci]